MLIKEQLGEAQKRIDQLEAEVRRLKAQIKAEYIAELLAYKWVVEHHREATRFGGMKFDIDFAFAIKKIYGFTLKEAYPIVESALDTIKKVDNGGL